MKLSKYVALAKRGYCKVIHVQGSGIWLGLKCAIYRAVELPDIHGEGQARAVLDIPEKAWGNTFFEEENAEGEHDICGFDMTGGAWELPAEELELQVNYKGVQATALRCTNGELLFYDTMLQIARPDEFIRQPGRWPNAANYGAVAYRIVDAQYWGVPQRRRRIYLVADFDGESAGDVVFERKGAPWYFDPRIPAGQTIAALAPDCYQWRTRMVSERGTVTFDGDAGATVDMTVYTERSPTLKASQKESVAIGLMAGQSASAGSTAAELEVAPTLRSSASGTNQAPTVVSLMGNVIDRQAGQNGAGIRDDGKSYTLDTISRHGVAYKKER